LSDAIILSRLALYGHHGVHAEEARLGQRFYVSLTCKLDLKPAGQVDDYHQSVCYASLAKLAYDIGTPDAFTLLKAWRKPSQHACSSGFQRLYPWRCGSKNPRLRFRSFLTAWRLNSRGSAMAKVALSLGSNMGKKCGNFSKALAALNAGGARIVACSTDYCTKPWSPVAHE
jgi:dihydroneopterin aldolase